MRGSTILFFATRAEREAAGDPRRSIEERYDSKTHYLSMVKQAAGELVRQGYLLEEDLETVVDLRSQHYDLLASREMVPQKERTGSLLRPPR